MGIGMNRGHWVALSIAIVVGVAIACGSETDEPTATPSAPLSDADGPDGQALFVATGCASCHGENAEVKHQGRTNT